MPLTEQLKALKGKLNAENDLGGQRDMTKIAELEQQIADLNIQILAENQQTQTEAIAQAQAEKLDSIALPFDFNEVFDDPRANEMIVELIKEFQAEANEEYNEKLKGINADHLEELRAATDRELQLKRQNDELQVRLDAEAKQAQVDAVELASLEQKVTQLELELNDALTKRDAAVREKEGIETLLAEKQEHIDKLREEIAVGAKAAINVTHIPGTDRLAALVEQSKSAKIKSAAELALERTEPFRGKVVATQQSLEEATFPAQASDSADIGLDNSQVSGIPASDQEVNFPELPSAQAPEVPDITTAGPVVDTASTNIGQSGQTVEERLGALEAHVFGYVKQAVA